MKTSSNHQSNILNNRSSSTINREQKKSPLNRGKSEWQKNALRICGNWSEQLSSKGKVYFYNCITEVSQWQKPPDWTLPDVNKKELLKMIADRQGFDGSSIKRTYASLNQVDRNRNRPQENPSPKRQKFQDTFKSTPEGFKLTRLTESSSNHDMDRISADSGTNTTNDHFRQLADDIRESLENILAKASVHANNIHDASNKNPSFIDERSLSGSESSSMSTGVVNKPPESQESCNENARHKLMANFQKTPLTCDISPSRAKFVHSQSNLSYKSNPLRNSPAFVGGIANGECSHRHVSDIIRKLDSFSSRQKMDFLSVGGASVYQKSIDMKLDGIRVPSISNHPNPDISTPTKPPTPSIQEKFNASPAYQPGSGNLQKQNLNNNETLRNIVTFLNTVVHARRDSPCTANSVSNLNKAIEPLNSTATDFTNSMKSTHRAHPRVEHPFPITSLCEFTANCSQRDSLRPIFLKSELGESHSVPPSCSMSLRDESPHSKNSNAVPTTASLSSNFCFDPSALTQLNHTHSCDSLPLLSVMRKGADDLRKSSSSYRDRLSTAIFNGEKPSPSDVFLENPEILKHLDSSLSIKFQNSVADSAEKEANVEFRKFDRLHSVLYSELSGELKKLRALVRISETKLNIHQKRKEALQDLMDVLEIRKSFSSLIQPDQS